MRPAEFNFHTNLGQSEVRAYVEGGTAFITVGGKDVVARFFLTIEEAREVAASLTKGLAERDLMAKAKADAAAQTEAA